MWRSPVAHLNGVQGVAGSNPVIPMVATHHLTCRYDVLRQIDFRGCMTQILTYGTVAPPDGCRTPQRKRPPSGGRLSLLYQPCPGDVGSSGLCHASGERGTPVRCSKCLAFCILRGCE